MAPETAQDNLVCIMYVVNEEGWYSLVLGFWKGRQLSVFQENSLKNPGHDSASSSVMVDALDHPVSKDLGKSWQGWKRIGLV